MLKNFGLAKLKPWRRSRNLAQIRGACHNAYLGDHVSLARVLGRYKMYLDTRDVAFTPHMLTDGYWEMAHTEVMAKLVKPGMTAIDIGANQGYFTLLMADCVGTNGTVHAIEPNPHLAALLRNTIEINGFAARTSVHQMALSDKPGKARFFIDPTRPMNATMIEREDHEVIEVPLQTYDDMPELAEADFIKIDVEGAEEAVWKGMSKRLADPRPLTVILEYTADRYHDASAFLEELTQTGFSLNCIHHWRGITPVSHSEVLNNSGAVDQLLVLRR